MVILHLGRITYPFIVLVHQLRLCTQCQLAVGSIFEQLQRFVHAFNVLLRHIVGIGTRIRNDFMFFI
ncbi:hypothetical protein D3C74_487560 [compost metagenome]